jgi:chloramphenicol 3-O phosphotransferase
LFDHVIAAQMKPTPRIIILNGTGSVGKTSTAQALQTITAELFLHVELDAFIGMIPPKMVGHPEGLIFETHHRDGKPYVTVKTGTQYEGVLVGMRQAIAAMAAHGNNLIIDDIVNGEEGVRRYRDLLSGHEVCFVGLFAPLDVIEARELARGDRPPGLARSGYERVHRGITYDLEIDTATSTPMEVAQKICDAYAL